MRTVGFVLGACKRLVVTFRSTSFGRRLVGRMSTHLQDASCSVVPVRLVWGRLPPEATAVLLWAAHKKTCSDVVQTHSCVCLNCALLSVLSYLLVDAVKILSVSSSDSCHLVWSFDVVRLFWGRCFCKASGCRGLWCYRVHTSSVVTRYLVRTCISLPAGVLETPLSS